MLNFQFCDSNKVCLNAHAHYFLIPCPRLQAFTIEMMALRYLKSNRHAMNANFNATILIEPVGILAACLL